MHTRLTADHSLALVASVPALVEDCRAALGSDAPACSDVDRDRLSDAWEDLVLDRLRPVLRMAASEPLFGDGSAAIADVGRVALVQEGPFRARVFIMLGYSRDYGSYCFGAGSHDGDSERVVLDLARPRDGDPESVVVVGAYTAAHEGGPTDHSRIFTGGRLAELQYDDDPRTHEPRWVVYASARKHATYATRDACASAMLGMVCVDDLCGSDASKYDVLPTILNAGEDAARRLTDLSMLGFAGEHAWSDRKFCGGRGGDGSSCTSSVRGELLLDPFTPRREPGAPKPVSAVAQARRPP